MESINLQFFRIFVIKCKFLNICNNNIVKLINLLHQNNDKTIPNRFQKFGPNKKD